MSTKVQQLCCQCRQAYFDYDEGIKTARSKRMTAAEYFSRHRPESDVSDAFMQQVKQLTEELATEAAKGCNSDDAVLLGELVALMLASKHDIDMAVAMPLKAVEQYAAPLLRYISSDIIRKIHSEYILQTPKREMLPKQRELLREMEKLIYTIS